MIGRPTKPGALMISARVRASPFGEITTCRAALSGLVPYWAGGSPELRPRRSRPKPSSRTRSL